MWATDYDAHSDGFFPGAPQMIGERIGPLSPEAKHQALAGRAMRFYGLHSYEAGLGSEALPGRARYSFSGVITRTSNPLPS
jgi:hypothetical protein